MKFYSALLSVAILLCPTLAFSAEFSNFGFYARDPQLQRSVACIDTPAWPAAECMATASKAIYAINKALGWEHYVFIGTITQAGAKQAYDSGTYVVTGLASDHQFLAVTVPVFDIRVAEILRAAIYITPAAITKFDPVSVLTHELIHAMGADHATCAGSWASVMVPSENCPAKSVGISKGDAATLRRAYPNPSWWRS